MLPRSAPLTIGAAIAAGTRYLEQHDLGYGQSTSSAVDDAAWLLLEAAELSPLEAPDYELVLSEPVVTRFESNLRRRAEAREPAAYIAGRTWFAGREFIADQRALVPRSPLAEFLGYGGFGLLDPLAVTRVLDLCTGGGCIGITCAYTFANASIDATDLSADALALAQENVGLHGLESRVRLLQGDLFEAPGLHQDYDLIISNPPYVSTDDIAAMPAEFEHEPVLGLEAGDDGLVIAKRMLQQAHAFLAPDGWLVVEVGRSAEALIDHFPELPFQWLEFEQGGDGVFCLQREDLLGETAAGVESD